MKDRDSCQTDRINLHFSKTKWSSHRNSLIVMHPFICSSNTDCIHHQSTKILSHFEEPTPVSKTIGMDFSIQTFLGSWMIVFQTKIFVFENFNLSKQNLDRWPLRHNVNNDPCWHTSEYDVYVHAMGFVHEFVELVSFETRISIFYGQKYISSKLSLNNQFCSSIHKSYFYQNLKK